MEICKFLGGGGPSVATALDSVWYICRSPKGVLYSKSRNLN